MYMYFPSFSLSLWILLHIHIHVILNFSPFSPPPRPVWSGPLPSLASHTAAAQDDYRAIRVWEPLKDLTHEDESIIDGFLQLACSPAVLYGGRNMELAYHFLYRLGGSVKVRTVQGEWSCDLLA